ncbi:HNH endonuclease [Mycobacterium phage Collard]|uniref:HNH endonuclease n=1 Tax=Mycobacterium phage Collard TaxID=2301704 RepID=A0A385DUT1_9CAUD|nr:HNH endonuclease [Mycobacterium phage Collard]AXQ63233.1 HNH endonuclease [Mycobacterium phage Collard]UEM46453.1 HNH endonuclease [Mycobacterium phage InvictusManeo]
MTVRRGTSNTNDRGSAAARRRRKQWLLDKFGDGTTCTCSTCPAVLTFDTITVDRYPIAGVDGGRYVRGNIRPQCSLCASRQGAGMSHARRRAARVIAAGAVAVAALTGCSSAPAGADGTVDGPGDVRVHWVDTPHGRLLCVFEKSGYGGGLSCDWTHLR